MKKQVNRILSLVLAAFMLISMLGGIVPEAHAASFSSVNGWYETIVAEISGVSDSDVTGVSYSGTMSGSLQGQDLEFLVRNTSGGVRIDIPGLKAGNYSLTVTTKSGNVTASDINVAAYDRSGYAHWNNTTGVGAYNDDGTIKSNAIVLYVTDSNKNSVTVTSKDGTTVTGIGNILNSAGAVGSSKGATNSNSGILLKLSQDGTPLVIRIVGNVTAPSGLTSYDSTDYGGTAGDNGYMARMKDAMNVTIEGIGNDAAINGWGIHFMCTDANPNYGKNFEVRNIAFKNVPEDCIGMEGVQSGSTLTASVERCWIHHCSFTGPKISNPAESDKDGGDGACDFKRGQYFTNSYCVYNGYHKTNLVGASDSNVQYHLTYHHNYYINCESRGPLARTANIHIYNSVFENQSSYCMSLRADTYIFSESNTFIDSKVTDGKTDGECKSYNNVFQGKCEKQDPITIVSSKSQTVSSNNKYANFDTNSSMSYIPSGDYILETASAAYNTVMASAGPMTTGSATTPESGGSSGGEADPDATTPSQPGGSTGGSTVPAGEYVHIFEVNDKTSNFYTITGDGTSTSKGTATVNGTTYETCFKMNSAATITFNAPTAGTFTMVFNTGSAGKTINANGTTHTIPADGVLTVDVPAGANTIKRQSGESFVFYIAYVSESSGETEPTTAPTEAPHSHSYSSSVTTAATCGAAGVRTFTCSCGHSYTETIAATGNHSYANGTCTVCGAKDPNYVAPTQPSEPTQPGHSHSYTSKVTAATCETAGFTTYTCSCGDSYVGDRVAATGHKYSGGKCSVCGASDPNSGTVSGGSSTGGGTGSITEAGGRLESAYVEWNAVSGASGYNVYVKPISGSYTQLDTELIRNYGSYWRADALGLSAGSYCMKIVPIINGSPNEGSSMVTTALQVVAHNRDGYAHSNGSVGAYNNDGTLKSNAIVVYVTASNINSVKATIGGTTYTGLDDIVYTGGKKGSVPICVRIVGEIDGRSTQVEIKENVVGITVEGVGEDATLNGWGVTLSKANNVEIRNLGFMNNATSEGDSVTLQNCTYCWVHNCDFFYGTDRGGDKDKGDGALDTKQSKNITHSYNHFWDCGKCNLQGSNTSDTSDNITYHHNWYDHSDSRHPRVRVATVHVYNNYYDGVAKYGIGNAYKAEVISEGNYFLNTKNPMLTSTQGSDVDETMSGETPGTLTSYNDYVEGATSWIPNVSGIQGATSWSANDYDCVIVNTRFSGYSYTLQSAADARISVMEYAGRMNGGDFEFEFTEADNIDFERNAKLDSALQSYSTSLKSVGGNSVSASTSNDGPASDDSSHTHSYVSSTTKDATCTEAGVITYTCECGASYTSPIAALGHNYVNGICSRCGAEESTSGGDEGGNEGGSTVPAGEYVHIFEVNEKTSNFYTFAGDNLSTSKGTATVNGTTYETCLKMNSKGSISFDAPTAGTFTMVFNTGSAGLTMNVNGTVYDIPSDGVLTVDVPAGANTIKRQSGESFVFYIAYVSESSGEEEHTHSYSAVVTAPTCTAQGFTTYTCSCGDSYVADYVNATGHSYSAVVTAPTCTAQGFTTYTCACGDSYVGDYVNATGHSFVNGSCSVCGAADPNYTAPTEPSEPDETEPTEPSVPVDPQPPVTGSQYIHNFTDDGFESSFFTFAGDQVTNGKHGTYTYDFGNGTETLDVALKFDSKGSITFTPDADGTVTIAVASSSAGRTVVINDGSSDIGTVSIDTAKQLFVLTVDVSANVTYTVARDSGESALYYIAYASESTGGDVHTHSYEAVVTDPTCTAAGFTTYTCSCGDSYVGDEVAATGHNHEVSVTAPTCTADGSRVYTCACGDTYSETIPATGHSYNKVVTAPTCEAQGYTTYTCACGDSYVADYVDATGHSYESVKVDATCENDGSITYTCACGDTYSEVIPATGHDYEAVVTAPTCTAQGYTTYTCTCGDSYVADYVAATGHSYEAVVTAPGCETQGYTTYTCACGDSYVADYVDAIGHSYNSNGVCSNCGEKDPNATPPMFLFSIAGSNMSLGNDLTMYFYVNQSDVASGNYYMQITKTYADGRADVVRTYDFADWVSYGTYYRVGFDGIAAKEMMDKIQVTIYRNDGAIASYTKVTTIAEYAVTVLSDNSPSSVACHTLMADMLNYGAAAQTSFGYNTGNLASDVMTATQKSYATKDFSMDQFSNKTVKGAGFMGGNLTLESKISMNLYFDQNLVDNTMTARVSYTDHYNKNVSYEIPGSEFFVLAGYGFVGVEIDSMVAADAQCMITVEIVDGGEVVASVSTSVESMAVVGYANTALYADMMTFCTSAYKYFHK